jgi:predicted kinase
VFARAEERAALATVAARSQVRFRGVFLTAPLHLRQERVGRRRGDASDADAAVAALQESYDLGALDWTTVDASGTPEDSLHRARAALGLGR